MRRAVMLTIGAAIVALVAAALAREARGLEPSGARTLLLGLCAFLVLEWVSHLFGSRSLWGGRSIKFERAAWAAVSSAGIWIALLAAVPFVISLAGLNPLGPAALALMVVAATSALFMRLWFLQEIYDLDFNRAATLWALTRGVAILIVFGVVALYTLRGAMGGFALPPLSLSP